MEKKTHITPLHCVLFYRAIRNATLYQYIQALVKFSTGKRNIVFGILVFWHAAK